MKSRLISSFLVFALILSLVPTFTIPVQAANTQENEINLYEDSDRVKFNTDMIFEEDTDGVSVSIWHYSGRYWAKNRNDKKVTDKELGSLSQGGVGNVEKAFEELVLKEDNTVELSWIIPLTKQSLIEKAIQEGKTLNASISKVSYNNNDNVKLYDMFNLEQGEEDAKGNILLATNSADDLRIKGLSARLVKEYNNEFKQNLWTIKMDLPINVNFYDERNELNFRDLIPGLSMYVPIPKLGYGCILYSMWNNEQRYNEKKERYEYYQDSKVNGGAARMWFAPEWETLDISDLKNNPFKYKDEYLSGDYEKYLMRNIITRKDGSSGYSYKAAGNTAFLYPSFVKPSGELVTKDNPYNNFMYGHPLYGYALPLEDYRVGGGTFDGSGAVGVCFDYNLHIKLYDTPPEPVDQVKVVSSYVKIDRFEFNGLLNKTKAVSTKADFSDVTMVEMEEEGVVNLFTSNKLPTYSKGNHIYYLNDILLSEKDLAGEHTSGVLSDVAWLGDNPSAFFNAIESQDIEGEDRDKILSNSKITTELETNLGIDESNILESVNKLNEAKDTIFSFILSPLSVNEIYNINNEDLPDDSTKLNLTLSDSSLDFNNKDTKPINLEDYNKIPVTEQAQEDYKKTQETENVTTSTEDIFTITPSLAGNGEVEEDLKGVKKVIYLRYLVFDNPTQVNILTTKKKDGTTTTEVLDPVMPLDTGETTRGFVHLVSLDDEGYTYKKSFTSKTHAEDVETINNIPLTQRDNQHDGGNMPEVIPGLPLDETVYVYWYIEEGNPSPTPPPSDIARAAAYKVPQWRLSKYWSSLKEGEAPIGMKLSPLTWGSCCCGDARTLLSPSGNWGHYFLNPNHTQLGSGNAESQKKVYSYLHSGVVDLGQTDTIYKTKLKASVGVQGNLNAIKNTANSNLKTATWLSNNTINDVYEIDSAITPTKSNATYKKSGEDTKLVYEVRNTSTYTNKYSVCSCYNIKTRSGTRHVHRCKLNSKTLTPRYFSYIIAPSITFDMYNAQPQNKLDNVQSEINEQNGLTTIKYQLKDVNLNIYPEYGMLFNDDTDTSTIKWVVGDQNRQISPVVYQTIQHKVYAVPMTTGTSVATDSRAITKASQLGLGKLQVIYKGAGANSAFSLYNNDKKNSAALMTVKTYALDFEDDGSYSQVKSAWGNGNYNSYREHENLLNAINAQSRANSTEKLLIDTSSYDSIDYIGGSIQQITNPYQLKKYNNSNNVAGGNAVVFEHKLIVRGGQVVAVKVQDRGTLAYGSPITLEQLRNKDINLYTALQNMNLIGDKANTIFKNFEHQTGDKLTEADYAVLLNQARSSKDGIDSSALAGVSTNTGWYSEDTTVLVVKEYVSNLTVPSVSVQDKISMSVAGLESPMNKNQFFSKLGKGYVYLGYKLNILGTEINKNAPSVDIYFNYSSLNLPENMHYKERVNGELAPNYLVPNASITDTTRLS